MKYLIDIFQLYIKIANQITNKLSGFGSDVRTRTVVEGGEVFNHFPPLSNRHKQMEIDYKNLFSKPYYVGEVVWNTSQVYGDTVNYFNVPSDFLNNPIIKKPFETCVFFRGKLCVLLQVSGTPMHSGTLVAASLPFPFSELEANGLSGYYGIPSMFAAPHVLLAANQASSVCLEVPFYSNNELMRTSALGDQTFSSILDNYAQLYIKVLNPLGIPTSGSSQLNVSVHAYFKDIEFYVPKVNTALTFEAQSKIIDSIQNYIKETTNDFIDKGREVVRYYTGLHNPNIPVIQQKDIITDINNPNISDKATYYQKLDPFANYDRIVKDPIFNSDKDESNINYILSKPMYVDTFAIRTSDNVNTLLFSRPITPFMCVQVEKTTLRKILFNPLEILTNNAQFWRGSFKLHLHSSMTNFHYFKVLVVLDYTGRQFLETVAPDPNEMRNLITHTLEFSSGNQVQTIELPFLSEMEMLPVTTDPITNAFQHGMLYVYLLQPLITNGSITNTVNLNAFISADNDFKLYGYPNNLTQNLTAITEEIPEMFQAQSAFAPIPISDTANLTSIDLPSDDTVVNDHIMRPLLTVNDFCSRLLPNQTIAIVTSGTGNTYYALKVAELLGLNGYDTVPMQGSVFKDLASLFLGFSGGVKIRVRYNGSTNVAFSYLPPSYRKTPNNVPVATSTIPNTSIVNEVQIFTALANLWSPRVDNSTGQYFQTVYKDIPEFRSATTTVYSVEEFTIPNMNSCKFVGDLSSRRLSIRQNEKVLYSSDLGTILIRIYGTAGTYYFNFSVGITDESRYGYQVICIPRALPWSSFPPFGNLAVTSQATNFVSPSLPSIDWVTSTPAAYKTN